MCDFRYSPMLSNSFGLNLLGGIYFFIWRIYFSWVLGGSCFVSTSCSLDASIARGTDSQTTIHCILLLFPAESVVPENVTMLRQCPDI